MAGANGPTQPRGTHLAESLARNGIPGLGYGSINSHWRKSQ
jgi:hypothetical protein